MAQQFFILTKYILIVSQIVNILKNQKNFNTIHFQCYSSGNTPPPTLWVTHKTAISSDLSLVMICPWLMLVFMLLSFLCMYELCFFYTRLSNTCSTLCIIEWVTIYFLYLAVEICRYFNCYVHGKKVIMIWWRMRRLYVLLYSRWRNFFQMSYLQLIHRIIYLYYGYADSHFTLLVRF